MINYKIILNILYKITNPSFYWELNFKIPNFFYFNKYLKIFYFLYWPIWRILSIILGIEIYGKTKIWKWLKLIHYWWIFINPKSIIWDNCNIYNNVTIWTKDFDWKWWSPKIWNNVKIWVWVRILWDIEIWDNCIIWANSVVLKSFKSNSIIWWIPAKIIK